MFAEIVRSRFAIADKQRAAEEARQAAMAIALTDYLTGLPNRRCFLALLAERIKPRGTGGRSPSASRPRRLQADQRHSRASGRRRNPQAGRRPARRGDGRSRLGRQDGRRRVRHRLRRNRRARRGDRARREIQAIFAAPFLVDGRDITLTGACGFALFPASAAEPDELVRLADAALYRAKA